VERWSTAGVLLSVVYQVRLVGACNGETERGPGAEAGVERRHLLALTGGFGDKSIVARSRSRCHRWERASSIPQHARLS